MIRLRIKNNILAVCLLYMSALNVLVYINNGTYKIIIIIITVTSILRAIKENRILRINGLVIWWILFTFWGILSLFWSYYADKDTAIVLFFITLNLIFLANYVTTEIRYISMLKAYMLSGVLLAIYLIAHYGIDGIVVHGRIPNDIINSNAAGAIFAFSVVISLYFLLRENNKLYLFLIVGLGTMVLLSGSRSAFLNAAFSILAFIYICYKKRIKLQHILVLVIIAILVCYLMIKVEIFYNIIGHRMQELWEIIIGKRSLTFGGSRESTYIRAYLYSLSWKTFLNNPLTGVGLNNFRYVNSLNAYAHSNIFELLASLGIIGMVFFYGLYIHFIFIFHKYKKYIEKKNQAIIWAFLIEVLIMSGFNVYYTRLHIHVLMMIFFMGMNVRFNKNKEILKL